MTDKLKITFTTINVTNNGEWTGKGELYWELLVDGQQVSELDKKNPRKVSDGETIVINQSYPVTKNADQVLTVEGSVSEKDNLDKDEFAKFLDTYTPDMSWGLGPHKHNLQDGRLDVTVNYKIERQ